MEIVFIILPLKYPGTSIWILDLILWVGIALILSYPINYLYGFFSKDWLLVSRNRLLFIMTVIIGLLIGGGISYFVIYKIFEQRLDEKDNKISELKDSNKSLNTKLEQQQQVQLIIVKSKEGEINELKEQIIALKEARQIKPVLTPEEIESNVRIWLDELGYDIDEYEAESLHFYFLATRGTVNKINIQLSKSNETLLVFRIEINFKPKDQEAINKLGRIELNNLVVEIKRILGDLNLVCSVKTPLKTIIFDEGLYIEELTKPKLFDVIKRLSIGRANVSSSLFTTLKVRPLGN